MLDIQFAAGTWPRSFYVGHCWPRFTWSRHKLHLYFQTNEEAWRFNEILRFCAINFFYCCFASIYFHCLQFQGILPKGPYYAWQVGPLRQVTIDLFEIAWITWIRTVTYYLNWPDPIPLCFLNILLLLIFISKYLVKIWAGFIRLKPQRWLIITG